MKRDLSVVVGDESQLETPSGSSSVQVSGNISCCNSNSKRFKGSKVNGFIVYSRVRKSNRNSKNCNLITRISSLHGVKSDVENGIEDQKCRVVDSVLDKVPVIEGTVNKESKKDAAIFRGGKLFASVNNGVSSGETENGEQVVFNANKGACKDEPSSEVKVVKLSSVLERDCREVPIAVADNCEMHKKKLRRFTRSASNKSPGETVEVLVNGLEAIDSEVVSTVSVEMIAEGSALTSPKKNLELKMSKKIALDNVPMTVKELFETGLLEGVPVVYMGGKKAFSLRGIIKDGGILCSCCSCNGCRVIPPSQFEIHAIKQYRRAAQYICFENGKSLLDVLNICRASPLESLEETIRSAIIGLPKERTFTCKRCKGTFPTICVGKVGPLCNTCAESKQSHGSLTNETSSKASSAERVLTLEPSRIDSLSTSSQEIDLSKIERNLSKSEIDTSTSKSAPVKFSSRKKPHWKIISKSFELESISRKVSVEVPSQKLKPQKSSSRILKPVPTSNPSKSMQVGLSSRKGQMRITTKRDQRLHKMVFERGGLPDGTEVAYYARGQKLLVGYKKGSGILCRCCNCKVSPSTFEAHAGWATRKKPYAYIYTSNGVSLHELAISLSRGRKNSAKDNDDLCIMCADGGNLVLCDGCPRAFHEGCACLSRIPDGDWYCQFCQNMVQKEKFVEYNANAVAAGRVIGVDPIEQITKRCVRVLKKLEVDLSGCALCRGYDFSRSGFGPRTIILCDQCEKEFHVGCLRSHKIANLKELPKGKWFCCPDCSKIHSNLHKFLVRGAEKIPDSLSHIVKKKLEEKGLETFGDIDLKWRLLSGKFTSPETKLLLSQAHAIFQECFDPIMDPTSGRNLIPLMVYGKNSKGQDYGGMHCAVLMVNSRVVSAGILRIFGQEVAELPLVATSNVYHGKGYFQLLFSCIEKLLACLNVQNLVLPAAEEAESMWTHKFGFQKIKADQLSKYRKSCCQLVTFEETSMLHKIVPACLNGSRNNYSIL